MSESPVQDASSEGESPRREFLLSGAMFGGLAAGYGTLAYMAGRYLYLYPTGTKTKGWRFVTELDAMGIGESLEFEAPTGMKIVIARQGNEGRKEDFVALSRVCPHLGCKVHWEPVEREFICPCHQGVFNEKGEATAGPPYDAGQSLARYPLKVERGLLYIEVPVVGLGSPEEV